MSGQPFGNMSMEALEIIVKHAKNLVCCRPANSGGGYISGDIYARVMNLLVRSLCDAVAHVSAAEAHQ